jgi:hypothetical protein
MRLNIWLIGGLAALMLLLASCGGMGGGPPANLPPASPAETTAALEGTATTAQALARELETEFQNLGSDLGLSSTTVQAMGSWASVTRALVPDTGLIATGQFQTTDPKVLGEAIRQTHPHTSFLPRGEYRCANTGCVRIGDRDDYIIRQDTSRGELVALVDWDDSTSGTPSRTVFVHGFHFDGTPDTSFLHEVPTRMLARVTLAGTVMAEGTLAIGWRASPCQSGRFLGDVPNSVLVNGFINRTAGTRVISVENVRFQITHNQILTSGAISAHSANNTATVNWNITSDGTVQRGTCDRLTGFEPTNLNFSAQVTANAHSMALSFLADQLQLDRNPASVRLSNGILRVGNSAVTFAGTLNDHNNNCVPGEHVNLTFSTGSTTLENYLINQFEMRTCPG